MKISYLIVTLLLISTIQGHKNCRFKSSPKDKSILKRREENDKRNLQASNPQRIRIKHDVTSLTTINDPKMKYFLTKTVEVAVQYFSDLIKVKQPLTKPIKIKERVCSRSSYIFSDQQMNLQYEDVDLIIYVTYTYDKNEEYVAYASGCQQDDEHNTGRNIVGMVNFNSYYVKPQNSYGFQNQLQTTLHELFHVLVFDDGLYDYFISPDGKKYDKKLYDNSDAMMKLPNVVKWVQNYYNCPTAVGMELENNGGPSSALSHWEMSILYDDTMTAAGDDTLWSGVNNALLLDSGWYEVTENFEDHLTWGRGKGCEFLEKKCKSDKKFNEFCYEDQKQGVTFSFHSTGFCNSAYWEPECMVVLPNREEGKKREVCYDPDTPNRQSTKYLNELFGDDSRAFFSTLQKTSNNDEKQTRCYNQKCSDDKTKIEISFGSETLTCTSSGQKLKSSLPGVKGELTCPNISEFCDKPNECYLQCSTNGYCLAGKCVCLPGYTGKGCECKEGTVYQKGTCNKCGDGCIVCSSSDVSSCSACKSGYVLKGDKCVICNSPCSTCIKSEDTCTSCNSNYFLDNNKCTKFQSDEHCDVPFNQTICKKCVEGKGLDANGKCTLSCDASCQTCSGSPTTCSSCKEGFILAQNQCVCEDGYYLNSKSNKCEKCSTYCKVCKDANTCDLCVESYSIDTKTKICKTCPDGSYLDSISNDCLKCDITCKQCEVTAKNCISCQEDATLTGEKGQQSCPCDEGFIISDNAKCIECNDCGTIINGVCICKPGYFMHEQYHYCAYCPLGCGKCSGSEQCDECEEGFKYNPKTNECDPCSEGYYIDPKIYKCNKCSPTCKTCKNAKICKTCIDGYYLDSNSKECLKCDKTCKECEVTAKNCISCQKGATLTGEKGSQSCPCNQGFTFFDDGYCYECGIHGTINNNVCSCKSGYFWHELNHKCEQCTPGCNKCHGTEQCDECSQQYQLNPKTKLCDLCSEGYEKQENGNCEVSNANKLLLSYLLIVLMLLI